MVNGVGQQLLSSYVRRCNCHFFSLLSSWVRQFKRITADLQACVHRLDSEFTAAERSVQCPQAGVLVAYS